MNGCRGRPSSSFFGKGDGTHIDVLTEPIVWEFNTIVKTFVTGVRNQSNASRGGQVGTLPIHLTLPRPIVMIYV